MTEPIACCLCRRPDRAAESVLFLDSHVSWCCKGRHRLLCERCATTITDLPRRPEGNYCRGHQWRRLHVPEPRVEMRMDVTAMALAHSAIDITRATFESLDAKLGGYCVQHRIAFDPAKLIHDDYTITQDDVDTGARGMPGDHRMTTFYLLET